VLCCFQEGTRETPVGFINCDAAQRDEWYGPLGCSCELCPVCLSEVPSSSIHASDDWKTQTNVDNRGTVLAVGKVVQDCAGGWLRMTINHGDPAEIWRIISLPSRRMKSASLLGVVDEVEVVA